MDNLPSFKYFRKITLLSCLRKARRSRDSSPLSLLIRYNTHAPWITASTIQANQNHNHFLFGYQYLITFGPFRSQNPFSGCNSGTDLVFVPEYIFFQLSSNTKKTLRLTGFRRSYVNCTALVLTNHCQIYSFLCLMRLLPNNSAFA